MNAIEDRMLRTAFQWGKRHVITLTVVVILLVVYGAELYVLGEYGGDIAVEVFVITSVTDPSLGWVFAPFSHSSIGHLTTNVAYLLTYGVYAEIHMSRREYASFVVLTGFISGMVQGVYYDVSGTSSGALGISGAALALLSYFGWHFVRHHEDELVLRFDSFAKGFGTYLALVSVFILGLQLASDFGLVSSLGTDTAKYAHVTGVMIGVVYEYLQSGFRGPCRV